MKYYKLLTYLLFLYSCGLICQDYTLDTIKDRYNFINWKANQIKLSKDSPAFQKLFQKMENIRQGKEEKLHVFHIGGSHIQADIYSNRLRTYLQHTNEKSKAQRGFIFPYKLAKTNNPSNYTAEYSGDWIGYRCSIKKDSIAWGLAGITAAFRDSISNVKIKANHRGYDAQYYDFNRIRIFYDNWTEDYEISFQDESLVNRSAENKEAHFKDFWLNKTVNEIDFCIEQVDTSETAEFLMMGLELMNDQTGFEYTTIGVNGASFEYYKRCAFFEEQLQLYSPDLFIVSVGTNDGYHPDFKPEEYRENYENFIKMVQKANPDCAVLLTVPNDSYYKRKYPNPRTRVMREIIYDLAKKYKMAVWDFYEIMGGFNSSNAWYQKKLMPRDRIHFTQLGYRIKADLLLEALSEAWEDSLQLENGVVLKDVLNE